MNAANSCMLSYLYTVHVLVNAQLIAHGGLVSDVIRVVLTGIVGSST